MDPHLIRESPQRTRLKSHAQIVWRMGRSERALGKIHQNSQLLTKPQEKVSRPRDLLERGTEDEPVVQVAGDLIAKTMHDGGDRGHDTGEDL